MRSRLAATLLGAVVVAGALAGCIAVPPPAPDPDPVPTIEFDAPDIDAWDQSVTIDDFSAYFPELDIEPLLRDVGQLQFQQNGAFWAVGNSTGRNAAIGWASGYVDLEKSGGGSQDPRYEGIDDVGERPIEFSLWGLGGDDEDAFILYLRTE